jgi:hypothetical protein
VHFGCRGGISSLNKGLLERSFLDEVPVLEPAGKEEPPHEMCLVGFARRAKDITREPLPVLRIEVREPESMSIIIYDLSRLIRESGILSSSAR